MIIARQGKIILGPCESLTKNQKQSRVRRKLKQTKYQLSFFPAFLSYALLGSFSILFSTFNTDFTINSLVGIKRHSVYKAFGSMPGTE